MTQDRIVNHVRSALNDQIPDSALNESVLEMLRNTPSNWNDTYWAAKYAWNYLNTDGSLDGIILESLESVMASGLTIQKDSSAFLDVSLLLAQLQFKYGKLRDASNYLLMLREHDDGNTPGWIYNYSAKLHFKLDIASAILTPSTVFGYIETSAMRSGGTLDAQAAAVIREYLVDTFEYFGLSSTHITELGNFLQYLSPRIEKYKLDSSPEWSQLLFLYSQINKRPAVGVGNHAIEAENRMLLGLLEERTKIIQQQRDEIISLQLQNHELEEALRDYSEESERKRRELVDQLREEIGIETKDETPLNSTRILVLGTPQISEKQMWGIAATLGLEKDQLDLHLDYSENKRFDLDKLRYSSPYGGILIGPVAHKVVGLGDYTSVIQKLQQEDGFPPIVEIRTHSGELKITKSSFREALNQILNTVKANTPAF